MTGNGVDEFQLPVSHLGDGDGAAAIELAAELLA
jgi:hypothetical protein